MKKFFVIAAAVLIPGGIIIAVYFYFRRSSAGNIGLSGISSGGGGSSTAGSNALSRLLSYVGGSGQSHGTGTSGGGGGSTIDLNGLIRSGAGLLKSGYNGVADLFRQPSAATRNSVADDISAGTFSNTIYGQSASFLNDNLSAPVDFSGLGSTFSNPSFDDFSSEPDAPIYSDYSGGYVNSGSIPDDFGGGDFGGYSDYGDYGGGGFSDYGGW